jgi:hypothetical protein
MYEQYSRYIHDQCFSSTLSVDISVPPVAKVQRPQELLCDFMYLCCTISGAKLVFSHNLALNEVALPYLHLSALVVLETEIGYEKRDDVTGILLIC